MITIQPSTKNRRAGIPMVAVSAIGMALGVCLALLVAATAFGISQYREKNVVFSDNRASMKIMAAMSRKMTELARENRSLQRQLAYGQRSRGLSASADDN